MLVTEGWRTQEPNIVFESQVLGVLLGNLKLIWADIEELCEVDFCILGLLDLFHSLHQVSVIIHDMVETS